MKVDSVLSHLLAKSTPLETLTHHSALTMRMVTPLRDRVGRLRFLPKGLIEDFWSIVKKSALCHDCGKVMAGFQDMITGRATSWGQRHEVASLAWLPCLIDDAEELAWVAVGVATHHRALTNDSEEAGKQSLWSQYYGLTSEEFAHSLGAVSASDAANLAVWLAKTMEVPQRAGVGDVHTTAHRLLEELMERWEDPVSAEIGLAGVMLQAAVTTADHLASAKGDVVVEQPLNADFATKLRRRHATLRLHQESAADHLGHIVVRAPTGSGKTKSGLLWAGAQTTDIAQATEGTPRVFYTLPFLAAINAMTQTISGEPDGIGDTAQVGVAHSRSGSYYLKACEDDSTSPVQQARKAVARREATRLFREPIRITTPYQLLRGTLAGPVHSGILLDAVNSVFIFDELHAYDPRRLGFILATMEFLDHVGSRIGILSATLPDILLDTIRESLPDISIVDGAGQGHPPRHRIRTHDHHLASDESLNAMAEQLQLGRSVLVVANNVKDAQHLYEKLAPAVEQRYGPEAAVLLHARFKRGDRSNIEQRLAERYRSGQQRLPGLVVGTQCVEVSLDIDMDVLYTSAAPLEALLQRFGRVNRLAILDPVDVHICQPQYTERKSSLYADGVYPHDPVQAAWRILCQANGDLVADQSINTWLNTVYDGDPGQAWQKEVRRHRDDFTRAFLTFTQPFDDRTHLEKAFDKLFDGTEAIMQADKDSYTAALAQDRKPSVGRLLGDEYLLPLPYNGATWAATWDKDLKVNVVDGEYDPKLGLTKLHPRTGGTGWFDLGEVLL